MSKKGQPFGRPRPALDVIKRNEFVRRLRECSEDMMRMSQERLVQLLDRANKGSRNEPPKPV